jgi:spore coat protein H
MDRAIIGNCMSWARDCFRLDRAGMLCALLWCAGTGFAKESKTETASAFFAREQVPEIRIEITGTNLFALRQSPRNYIRAKVHEGNVTYTDVGVHLKGAAGSFRMLDSGLGQGPAFTLNFDKFQDHQKFHGLDKIHLNNSVQDPSYMTEIICGDLFRAAGVPTPRGTHARVRFNGRDLGLYVLKEGFDKSFLQQYFTNTHGNCYDGGFLREITDPLQRTSGDDVKDYSDLKRLVAAARESDPLERMARLENSLDVDRFLSFIAMEMMTWHWDGYAMKRNNYKVFHDLSSDKMVFFPHGMDQMFWVPDGRIFPKNDGESGLVARALLATAEGKRRYKERFGLLLTNVFKLEVLTNRMNELQHRIRPVLASIHPDLARNHDGAVNNLRNQIIARAKGLDRLFHMPDPVPLRFDANGIARIHSWRIQDTPGIAKLDQVSHEGRKLLHIDAAADRKCTASWRCLVRLKSGLYHFEALARTAGVVPIKDKKGDGAGIRYHDTQTVRTNSLSGDSEWTKLAYDIPVPVGSDSEVDLLCELRASKGEVWFDLDSIKLTRSKGP